MNVKWKVVGQWGLPLVGAATKVSPSLAYVGPKINPGGTKPRPHSKFSTKIDGSKFQSCPLPDSSFELCSPGCLQIHSPPAISPVQRLQDFGIAPASCFSLTIGSTLAPSCCQAWGGHSLLMLPLPFRVANLLATRFCGGGTSYSKPCPCWPMVCSGPTATS